MAARHLSHLLPLLLVGPSLSTPGVLQPASLDATEVPVAKQSLTQAFIGDPSGISALVARHKDREALVEWGGYDRANDAPWPNTWVGRETC